MNSKLLPFLISFFASLTIHAQPATFDWAGLISGSMNKAVNEMSIDPTGNTIIAGYFYGTVDFDPSSATYNLQGSDPNFVRPDLFISKYSPSGSLIWAKQIIVHNFSSLTTDQYGNIYVSGSFSGTVDFDPDTSVYNLSSVSGFFSSYLLKLDVNGDFKMAIRTISDNSSISALNIDNQGGIRGVGTYTNYISFFNFNGTSIVHTLTTGSPNTSKRFIQHFDSTGTFLWAKEFDPVFDKVIFDQQGNHYIFGTFYGVVDFDPDTGVYSMSTSSSQYLLKLDQNSNFLWARKIDDRINFQSFHADQWGHLYGTGYYEQRFVDFNPDSTVQTYLPHNYDKDVFYIKYDPLGSLAWVKNMGSFSADLGKDINSDQLGNTYLMSMVGDSIDVDPSIGVSMVRSSSLNSPIEQLIQRFDTAGNMIWYLQIEKGNNNPYLRYLIRTDSNNIYASGPIFSSTDMDPGPGINILHCCTGGTDIYLLKLNDQISTSHREKDEPVKNASLFPNPSEGIYYLNNKDQEWHELLITDLQGRTIFQQDQLPKGTIAINLQDHENGVYMIQLEGEGKRFGQKVLKQ